MGMNGLLLRFYYIKYMTKHIWYKSYHETHPKWRPQKVIGKVVPSVQYNSDILGAFIDSRKPFSLFRPGNGETSAVYEWLEHKMFCTNRYKRQGVFSITCDGDYDIFEKWCSVFLEDLGQCDLFYLLGIPSYMEHFLIKSFCDKNVYVGNYLYGTWDQTIQNHWINKLGGKKVLFISPFADTMKSQWERYDRVCGNFRCLPLDIQPLFMKSVWYSSIYKEFDCWFDALDCLKQRVHGYDFDICLISCGPFSTFLAAEVKRMGKQAIQYGGEMQLLFGIMGSRWEGTFFEYEYMNEYWVRPSDDEKVGDYKKLENAAYW